MAPAILMRRIVAPIVLRRHGFVGQCFGFNGKWQAYRNLWVPASPTLLAHAAFGDWLPG
jgi:hypothetical protein